MLNIIQNLILIIMREGLCTGWRCIRKINSPLSQEVKGNVQDWKINSNVLFRGLEVKNRKISSRELGTGWE